MAIPKKVFERLTKAYESASEKELNEALDTAKHLLSGQPDNTDAKAEIEFLTELLGDKVKTPEKVKVKAIKHVIVDGVRFGPGQSGEISKKQHGALARFFEVLKLIAFIALLFSAAAPAFAGPYNIYGVTNTLGAGTLNGGTNNAAANSTVTYNAPIGVTRFQEIAVQISDSSTSGASGADIWTFQQSIDNTNWFPAFTLTNTMSGTSTITSGNNGYAMNSAGYLRLQNVVTASADTTHNRTNIQVIYSLKQTRFGP